MFPAAKDPTGGERIPFTVSLRCDMLTARVRSRQVDRVRIEAMVEGCMSILVGQACASTNHVNSAILNQTTR